MLVVMASGEDGGRESTAALAWRQVCPRCGSGSVIPILYAVSNPTAQALVTHGVLELGDPTAASEATRPTSRCRSCEHTWTTGRRSA